MVRRVCPLFSEIEKLINAFKYAFKYQGKHLGYYNVEEAAAVAYDIEGRKHGMSHLNFPLYDNENFALDESDRTDLSIEVAEIYPEVMPNSAQA